MDEFENRFVSLKTAHLRVKVDRSVCVASLRYADTEGSFARITESVAGVAMPAPLSASYRTPHTDGGQTIVAWRSPTERILICDDSSILTQMKIQTKAVGDGCIVDQTGGLWVIQTHGAGVADLFAKLGGQGTLPGPGQSLGSRLADVPVLAVHAHCSAILWLADRMHVEHLLGRIRTIAAA